MPLDRRLAATTAVAQEIFFLWPDLDGRRRTYCHISDRSRDGYEMDDGTAHPNALDVAARHTARQALVHRGAVAGNHRVRVDRGVDHPRRRAHERRKAHPHSHFQWS